MDELKKTADKAENNNQTTIKEPVEPQNNFKQNGKAEENKPKDNKVEGNKTEGSNTTKNSPETIKKKTAKKGSKEDVKPKARKKPKQNKKTNKLENEQSLEKKEKSDVLKTNGTEITKKDIQENKKSTEQAEHQSVSKKKSEKPDLEKIGKNSLKMQGEKAKETDGASAENDNIEKEPNLNKQEGLIDNSDNLESSEKKPPVKEPSQKQLEKLNNLDNTGIKTAELPDNKKPENIPNNEKPDKLPDTNTNLKIDDEKDSAKSKNENSKKTNNELKDRKNVEAVEDNVKNINNKKAEYNKENSAEATAEKNVSQNNTGQTENKAKDSESKEIPSKHIVVPSGDITTNSSENNSENSTDKNNNQKTENTNTNELEPSLEDSKHKNGAKKVIIWILVIVAIIAAVCGIKYKYDEETNVLSLKVNTNMPVQLEEKKARKFKAKSLVQKCTGDLRISGNLDSQKYTKQTINFTYTKGWSTKKKHIDIIVIKTNDQPTITLNNDLINVQLNDKKFKISDAVESIADSNGNAIPLKSKTKIYKKVPKSKTNIAYFTGDKVNVKKEGVYIVHLTAYDVQGIKAKASFVINVTKDKEEADKRIDDIKNNVKDNGTIVDANNSDSTVVNNEIVNDDSNSYVIAETSPNNSSTTAVQNRQTSTSDSRTSSASNSGTNNNTQSSVTNNTSNNQNASSSTTSRTSGNTRKKASTSNRRNNSSSSSNNTVNTVPAENVCVPTPAVNGTSVFDIYTDAVNAAKATGLSVETQTDSCENTIYVLV